MLSIFFFYGGFGVFVLRITVAAILIAHGWPKLKDLKATWGWMDSVGFKPGKLFGTLAAILEFFGGIALALGFLVQVVAFFSALQFFTIIIWKLARKTPFTGQHGWELDLILLAASVTLVFLGGGVWSLDRVLFIGLY